MKTKIVSLFVIILIATTPCLAQNNITVQAANDDISNNLDLKAVATAFGESKNLEEFEQKLNDYNSGISNLDLNNDGQVDYLRVIEKNENNIHVVVIQAVLGENSYQDVASIVVERDQNSNTSVQVIGDPYLYGDNYIIEPTYLYTPSIFSFFWGPDYYNWYSPYYWGYYPSYYHYRRPFELGIYLSRISSRINHNQRYYYTNRIRDHRAERILNSVRRNDYGNRFPDRGFSSRNQNIRNKRDFEFNRNGVVRNPGRSTYQGNPNENRPTRTYDNSNNSRNIQSNGLNQRNENPRIYRAPYNSGNMNSYGNRNINQSRTYNNESGSRSWQNSGVYRNQSNSNNQNYTPPTKNNNPNVNGIQRNNTYQQNGNSVNIKRENSVNQNNEGNRDYIQRSPSDHAVQNKTANPPVREQRSESRDNSSNNGRR
jgi:hypothetical protein